MDKPNLPAPVCLYDTPRAPNPRRVGIFLAEKGIALERRVVNLMEGEHKASAYLAKTGAPQVPALELEDGAVLIETQAICRYLEALYPLPNMMGGDPRELAEVEMWQRRVEFGLFLSVMMTFRHTNPHMGALQVQNAAFGATMRDRIERDMQTLDRRLANRNWIALDRFTVADITAVVATDFLKVIRYEIPDGLDAYAAWVARVRARPSCQFKK